MYNPNRLNMALVGVVILSLISFIVSCEPYQTITLVNKTLSPIKVDIRAVSLDYSDTPFLTWNFPADVIKPGETQSLIYPIYNDRSMGVKKKYPITAIIETNQIVFYKIFTWDELHDMGWRVVISPYEKTDNTTIGDDISISNSQ